MFGCYHPNIIGLDKQANFNHNYSKRLGDSMKYQIENFNGILDYRSRFHRSWNVGIHLHEYSEVLYCKEGQGTVLVNGCSVQLKAGQFVWLPPNYIHQYDFPDAELVCAVFSNDFVPLYFQASEGKHLVVSAIEAGNLSTILECLHTLKKEDALYISGCLNLICSEVMKRSEFSAAMQSDHVLFQKVITYLEEHCDEDITLAETARYFGYNEKYLSHTLHSLTGIHFRKLLSFYRVNHAKKLLLKSPELSVAQIAMKCGFSAINTFHRAFKDMTGMTPWEYRQKNRQ